MNGTQSHYMIFNFSMGVNKEYTTTINQREEYDFHFGMSTCEEY